MIKNLNTLFCKECRIEDDGLITLASIYSGFSRKDMPASIPLCFVCFLELPLVNQNSCVSDEFNSRVVITAPWGLTIGDSRQKIPLYKFPKQLPLAPL
jgi:hypothetical protein